MSSMPEKIHVFATDDCNLDCAYCFRHYSSDKKSSRNLLRIAEILAKNDVERVVIGGGEPTLVKNLDDMLRILKKEDIFVELHTNCTTLTRARLEKYKKEDLVDVIGIPIDTLDKNVQRQLRNYPDYINLIKRVAKDCQDLGFKIVYHTVATDLNINQVPALYNGFIKNTDFDLWKVYEFNKNLALRGNVWSRASQSEKLRRHNQIMEMNGPINHEKGCSDSLLAKFLLTEEQMKKHKDRRIKFAGLMDEGSAYFFIDDAGDVNYYTWFSKEREERLKIGNLLAEGFPKIVEKFNTIEKEGYPNSSSDFFGAINDLPVFARLYEGNFDNEELDKIKSRYWPKVEKLTHLWEKRMYGKIQTKFCT